MVKFTQYQYGLFHMISSGTMTMSTIFYSYYLRKVETRTLFRWATCFSIIANLLSYCFVMRWNLLFGISDYYFMFFDDVVLLTLMKAFTIMPAMVLFAKITPRSIEGTCFAFITGTSSFCHQVL